MGTSPVETPKPGGDSGLHDRRLAARRNVVDAHLVTVDLAFQSGALVLDLSETGMGVQALSSAPMGATTSLQFELPETGGRVDAVGKIAWTDTSGRLGIRFDEVAEVGRVHLAQWLSRDRRPVVLPGLTAALPAWPAPYARDEIAALRRDLTTEKLAGDAALAFVVERVRNVTRATGAAIAMEDGGAVVCRASSGNAPSIGARLDPNAGLSGECIRTGEIVRCEDTETDPRADRLVCRKLDLRSLVIVPVRVQGRPAGVLEAFSSRAHAFQSNDVLLLRRVADLVAGIAVRQPETAASAISGPQALMAAATLKPLMAEPSLQPEPPPAKDGTFAVGDKTAPLASPPMAHKPGPSPDSDKMLAAPPSRPQPGMDNAAKPATVARPAPPPPAVAPVARRAPTPAMENTEGPLAAAAAGQESATTAAPAMLATRSSAAPLEVVTAAATPTAAMRAMGAAAVAASAVAKYRPVPVELEADEAADRLEPVSPRELLRASQIPSPWRLRLTGAGILAAVLIVGSWQVWRAIAPPRGTPMDSEVKQAKLAVNPPAPLPEPNSAKPSPATVLPLPGLPVAGTPHAGTVKVANPPAATKSSAARPAPRAAVTTPAVSEAPKVEVAEAPAAMGLERPSGLSGISSVLSVPVASPALDKTAISELTGGKLLLRYNPVRPNASAALSGEVVLKATIGKDGKVSSVRIVRGQPLLAQSAASAVKRWRYEPFRLNGIPIEIENTIVVNFKAVGQ